MFNSAFKIKDLGKLKYFFGLEVAYLMLVFMYAIGNIAWTYSKTLAYLVPSLLLLIWIPLSRCTMMTTHMDLSVKMHHDGGQSYKDRYSYRRLI